MIACTGTPCRANHVAVAPRSEAGGKAIVSTPNSFITSRTSFRNRSNDKCLGGVYVTNKNSEELRLFAVTDKYVFHQNKGHMCCTDDAVIGS